MAIVNKGGMLWLFGGKVEHKGQKVQLSEGSLNEFLGGFYYGSFKPRETLPAISVTDSALSLVSHRAHSYGGGGWDTFVRATRDGESVDIKRWDIDHLNIVTEADREKVKGMK